MNEQTNEKVEQPASVERLLSPAIRNRILRRMTDLYDESPVRWTEIVSLLLIVLLCDVTVFRGNGLAGYAALVIGLPVLLLIGVPSKKPLRATWLFGLLVIGVAARLLWYGSGLGVACGLVVLVCFAMSLVGRTPYLLHAAVFASQSFAAGHHGLNHYGAALSQIRPSVRIQNVLALILPVVTLVVFGTLFIFANPDLVEAVSSRLKYVLEVASQWLIDLTPEPFEILFCIVVGWIAVGLLRPILPATLIPDGEDSDAEPSEGSRALSKGEPSEGEPTPLFEAYRNTLIVVTGLFAVYLTFEFQTLWFREFPEGFHYSGYAHEGAAWLTVALGLATVMLSLMFRGRVLSDPRLRLLRKLSWLWSVENVILALAVYNRLSIYVNFNGMTRMRTVGLLGMTAVLVGFLLVVLKISKGHDFRWLVRRQLWTLAFAVYLYAVLPVDAWVMQHNVARVLAGDLSPSVQISVHPTSSEGILQLLPLIHCEDSIIREGVKAILAQRQIDAEKLAARQAELGWTAQQIADNHLLSTQRNSQNDWSEYTDESLRSTTITRFHEYVYKWF